MHGVNGMMFNNLPGLQMVSYERTRWYVLGMGSDFDIHSVHWHGQTFLDRGLHRGDVTLVIPGFVSVVDLIPDNPGLWLTHCECCLPDPLLQPHILSPLSLFLSLYLSVLSM